MNYILTQQELDELRSGKAAFEILGKIENRYSKFLTDAIGLRKDIPFSDDDCTILGKYMADLTGLFCDFHIDSYKLLTASESGLTKEMLANQMSYFGTKD